MECELEEFISCEDSALFVARLLVRLALLLHELKPPGALDGPAMNLPQRAAKGQALPNEARDENLGSLLPLIHHFLRRHHLKRDGKKLIKSPSKRLKALLPGLHLNG